MFLDKERLSYRMSVKPSQQDMSLTLAKCQMMIKCVFRRKFQGNTVASIFLEQRPLNT